MPLKKINLAAALNSIDKHWTPTICGEVNGTQLKLVRFIGEFVWHSHADEDEAFLVLYGEMTMELRDGNVQLGPGELIVIPRGVEHRPVCAEECRVLLIEPASTLNTGDADDPRTLRELPRI